MASDYYISKGKSQLGPCSLDDLRTLLAYGSVNHSDLVRRGEEGPWLTLDSLGEMSDFFKGADASETTSRRRTVRYRDFEKTPQESRAPVVLKRLILGFLFFPPLLWRAAVTVYQSRVITRRRNESGYLEHWPRWVEGAVSAMIVVNALLWWMLLSWAGHEVEPMVRIIASTFGSGIEAIQEWLGNATPPP